MRWIASLVAEAYRILIRGGVFLYPGDQRQGLSPGPAAPGLRGQPDRLPDRAGGRRRHRHGQPHPRPRARAACTSACRWSSARRARSTRIARYHTEPERDRRARAAVRQSRPVPRLSGARRCRPSIPSSRSPALPARAPPRSSASSSRSSAARRSRPPSSRATPSTATTAPAMKDKVAEEEKQRQPELHPFPRRGQRARDRCEEVFEEYGRRGTGRTRTYVHDEEEAKRLRHAARHLHRLARVSAERPALLRGPAWLRGDRQGRPRQACRPEDRRRAGHQSRMDPEDPSRPRRRAAIRPKR